MSEDFKALEAYEFSKRTEPVLHALENMVSDYDRYVTRPVSQNIAKIPL